MTDTPDEAALYRLAKKSSFWAAFTPSAHAGGATTWQLQVSSRARGGKVQAVLLETTPLRPLASVTLKGETFPLTIGWHQARRGGVLCFGGERKTWQTGETLAWEMRWTPVPGEEDCFQVEMRLRATPRRDGHVRLSLPAALHRPDEWALRSAARNGHCAVTVRSAYSRHSVGFVMLDGAAEPCWDAPSGCFRATLSPFPLGGGKLISFSLRFGPAQEAAETRGPLVTQYAAVAGTRLHPLESITPLDPSAAVAHWTAPSAHTVKGTERLYLRPPDGETGVFYAGAPHFPLETLKALWDWHCLHPSDEIARLVRFGARGLAADFPVMGRAGHAEPNKGAFWDRMRDGEFSDFAGGATHGLAANARIARDLFLLHTATGEPLFRQSALNVCQWLLLKQNAEGYYDGERVWATRGREDDGRFIPHECTLGGASAIRPLVLAFRATGNEVWVKAAWKIANFLLEHRIREFADAPPAAVAAVLLGLLALDAEAPNARLRAALRAWGAWLRTLPLDSVSSPLIPDDSHDGLYECARAGFLMHALDAEPAYLRYGFAALAAVPPETAARSGRALAAQASALLSLGCLIPGAKPDFDALSLTLGWRVFAPDPATAAFLRVTAGDGAPVDFLPLVCRLNDQLLLIVLAPPGVESVAVLKNGRRPLVRDLFTEDLDSEAPLHRVAGEDWARVGLFTVDP